MVLVPRSFTPASLLLVATLLVPGRLLAQPVGAEAEPKGREAESRAKIRYEQGVEAYQEERFRDAVKHFEAADAIAPKAALSFNIARVFEKMGDPGRALEHYRRYLRRDANAQNRRDVSERIQILQDQLRARGVQQLYVGSQPSEAHLTIDRRAVGVTPWTGELVPGRHVLRISKAGHIEQELTLELPAERAVDIDVTLPPAANTRREPAAPMSTPSTAVPAHDDAPLAPSAHPSRRLTLAHAAPDDEHPEGQGSTFGAWPWAAVGLGGGALIGAGVFEGLRASAAEDAREEAQRPASTQYSVRERNDSAEGRQTAARVLLGAGSVLVVAGAALLVVDWRRGEDQRTSAALGCLPQACFGSFEGAF